MFHRPRRDKDDTKPLEITSLRDRSSSGAHDAAQPSGDDAGPAQKKTPQKRQLSRAKAPPYDKKPAGRRRGGPRPPKEMTEARIRNISEFYVSQREASTGMLRDMLRRRSFAWLNTLEDEDKIAARALLEERIEACIASLVERGFINDRRYALMKARGWRRSGKAARRIAMDLARKGISQTLIEEIITEVDQETIEEQGGDPDRAAIETEYHAAQELARRKRIGPYRSKPAPDDRQDMAKLWRREAGILARAGFGMDLIRQILDREPDIDPE